MAKHKGTRPPVSFSPAPARANPALWGYGFGAALIVLGLLVLSIALGSALRAATRGVHKASLPGANTFHLKEGLYVAILPATGKSPLAAADVEISLTDESGAEVPRVPFPPEMALANGKIGTTLFQTQIMFPGTYVLKGRLPEEAAPAELLLVHESLRRNPSDILVGVILMAVLSGFGLYMIWITYRRGRAVAPPEK